MLHSVGYMALQINQIQRLQRVLGNNVDSYPACSGAQRSLAIGAVSGIAPAGAVQLSQITL